MLKLLQEFLALLSTYHEKSMHACRWDCHGLPVEFEIDKKLGESLQALSQSQYPLHNLAMHALGFTVSLDLLPSNV